MDINETKKLRRMSTGKAVGRALMTGVLVTSLTLSPVLGGPLAVYAEEVAAEQTADTESGASGVKKNEIIYAKADASGKVSGSYVVNLFDVDEDTRVSDPAAYTDVENLSDNQDLEQEDGAVSIDLTAGEPFYYQGDLPEGTELPWDLSIVYRLDGKEVSPEDLAGKSGELEIEFSVTAHEDSDFANACVLQAQGTFDESSFKLTDAGGTTEAHSGNSTVLSAMVLPGESKSFTIVGEARDFEYSGWQVAAMPFSMAIDIASQAGELTEQTEELSDATAQLSSGSESLASALSQLSSGAGTLSSGAASAASGASELASGTSQVASGANSLASGAGDLVSGADSLASGTAQVADGASALQAEGTSSVAEGASQLESGAQSVASGASSVSSGASSLADGMSSLTANSAGLNSGASQVASGASEVASGAASLYSALQGAASQIPGTQSVPDTSGAQAQLESAVAALCAAAANGEDTSAYTGAVYSAAAAVGQANYGAGYATGVNDVSSAASSALASATGAAGTLSAGASQVESGAASLQQGISEYTGAADTLSSGASSLKDGAAQVASGSSQVAGASSNLSSGASKVDANAQALAAGASSASAGASQLADGAKSAASGATTLVSALSSVNTGAQQLAAGAGELASGSETLAGGISQTYDGSTELADGAAELAEATSGLGDKIIDEVQAKIDEKLGGDFQVHSFVVPENTDVSRVQFVYVVDGVEASEDEEADEASDDSSDETVIDRFFALFSGDEEE